MAFVKLTLFWSTRENRQRTPWTSRKHWLTMQEVILRGKLKTLKTLITKKTPFFRFYRYALKYASNLTVEIEKLPERNFWKLRTLCRFKVCSRQFLFNLMKASSPFTLSSLNSKRLNLLFLAVYRKFQIILTTECKHDFDFQLIVPELRRQQQLVELKPSP